MTPSSTQAATEPDPGGQVPEMEASISETVLRQRKPPGTERHYRRREGATISKILVPSGTILRHPLKDRSQEMKIPTSVKTLEDFGREKLSRTFFMRDFLYSEISAIEGIPNIPSNPDLALDVGKRLCEEVLEPIQDRLGRIAIRSAFRAAAVNAKGAENGNQYGCASNERNRAFHIWDERDADGFMGAAACIVIPSFLDYYGRTQRWQALAWWVHDNIPGYSGLEFFSGSLCAFNVSWHQNPKKVIYSYVGDKGWLTKQGMENHAGRHDEEYAEWMAELGGHVGE